MLIQYMTIFSLCLSLIVCLHTVLASALLLTPPFPPTGFFNQTYAVRFQAAALFKPTFSFEGLPAFLKGFANGTMAGTPTEVGSFKITVKYSDKSHSGSEDVIICIASGSSEGVSLDPKTPSFNSPILISPSDKGWIFRAGDEIGIGFQYMNAVDPVAVSFTNLPAELTADNSSIQGVITAPGLYTFSLVVGDALGYRALSYFTINIQPKSANLATSAPANIGIIDVPVKNAAYDVDLVALQSSQTTAANAVKTALQKVVNAKNNVTMVQNALYGTANDLVLAQQSSLTFQQAYTDAQQNLNSLQTYINNGASAIKAYNIRVNLLNTSLSQLNASLPTIQSTYETALSILQNCSQILNNSVGALAIASQDRSTASTQYNVLGAAATSARNAFNTSASNLEVAKQAMNDAQGMLDNANQVVSVAQLNLQLATQDNDAADSNFQTAINNVQIANKNAQSVSSYIKEGSAALQKAKADLGVAKFNLIQANNNLLVAQAAKEVSDKAIAIIVAQGNTEITASNSVASASWQKSSASSVFTGCKNYAYPSMFGTDKVEEVLSDGVRTLGGHRLAWGDCTKKSSVGVGDLIYYEGSLIASIVNLWLLVNLSS